MSQVKILNDRLHPDITNIIVNYNLPTKLINFHKRRDVKRQIDNFKIFDAYSSNHLINFYGKDHYDDFLKYKKIRKI